MNVPSFLSLRSVRARLTLWNVLVMVVLLFTLGITLRYLALARLEASLDDQLVDHVQRMSSMRAPPFEGFHGPLGGVGGSVGPGGPGEPAPPGTSWEFHFSRFGPDHGPDYGPGREPGFGRGDKGRRPPSQPDTIAEARQERAVQRGTGANDNDAAAPIVLMPRYLSPDGLSHQPGVKSYPAWDPASFSRSLNGESLFSTITVDGEPLRVYSAPRRSGGRVIGVFQAVATLTETRQEVSRITGNLLTMLPFALVGVAVTGAFLTGRALRPVQRITEAAERIEVRNLSGRLVVRGDDEFARLAMTFNGMLERLELAFARQRRFTADASHELRTPLTIIKTNTSLALSSERDPEEYRRSLTTVDQAADMMTRIVEDLLFLARTEAAGAVAPTAALPTETVLIDEVLTLAVTAVRSPAKAPISVETSDSSLCVYGDRYDLMRLFSNLLSNAVRHTPPEGRVRVSAFASDDSRAVIVTVTDTGSGIAPEDLPHVFEPFFQAETARTRSPEAERHSGIGLGLSICQAIVEAHGGTISLESTVGQGTTVRVTLPA